MNALDAAILREWRFPILLRRSYFAPGQALVITSVSKTEPLAVIAGYVRNGTLAEAPRHHGLLEKDYKFYHEAYSPDQGFEKDLSFCAEIISEIAAKLLGRHPHEADEVANVDSI